MKKTILLLITSASISCGKETQNYENLMKVKVGDTYQQVAYKMSNSPKEIKNAYWADSLFVQFYDSPPGASDDYGIVFNKEDSIVVEILYGD